MRHNCPTMRPRPRAATKTLTLARGSQGKVLEDQAITLCRGRPARGTGSSHPAPRTPHQVGSPRPAAREPERATSAGVPRAAGSEQEPWAQAPASPPDLGANKASNGSARGEMTRTGVTGLTGRGQAPHLCLEGGFVL